MSLNIAESFGQRLKSLLLSVPVRWKIIGIGTLPVLILGLSLNYWVTVSLSDWLSYILADVRVTAAMQAGSRSVLFVTVLAAILSIFLSLFFTTLLTGPLLELKKTAEEVASGKFETRVKVWAKDEIGAMAMSINQMIDNFVRIQDDLSRTNQQLAAINRIALAADQENEIHDVLYVALTNVVRHAHATRVVVEIKEQAQMIHMKIDDDGAGFDPAKITVREGERHLGLISMSERGRLFGGHFEISSAPSQGTTLEAVLPIPAVEPA